MSIRTRLGKLEKVSLSGEADWCPVFETDACGSLIAGEFPQVGLPRMVREKGETSEDFRNRVYRETSRATSDRSEGVHRRLTMETLEGCLKTLARELAEQIPMLLDQLKESEELQFQRKLSTLRS